MVILVPLLAAAAIASVNALPENAYRWSQIKDLIPRSPLRATQAASGCITTYPDWFMLTATDAQNAKRGLSKRECHEEGTLMTSIQNGVLTDVYGRTGCIVANYQFQFDGPPQAGTIYSSGWSVCDGKLNLGSQDIFWKCPSGRDNGEIFYNLYDRQWTGHCEPIYMEMLPCSGSTAPHRDSPGQSGTMNEIPDGQPQLGKGTVGQIGDGQIQAPQGGHVTQIGDGQIQAPKTTGKGQVTQISDGQIQAPKTTGKGQVTQIGDGQIQAPKTTGKGQVTQISDGQIQAPKQTAGPAACTSSCNGRQPIGVIPDGQPQAPNKGRPIGVIPDGQPQAPSGSGSSSGYGNRPIGVIPDGQPQAPSGSGSSSGYGNRPIGVIPDGQPQAPTGKGSSYPKSTGNPLNVIPDGQPQAGRKAIAQEAANYFKNIGAVAQVPVIMGGVLGVVAVVLG